MGRKCGCPFGCAQAHRRRQWRQTSLEYYQDPQGRKRKSEHNQRRKHKPTPAPPPEPAPGPPPRPEIPSSLVGYVQRVVSVIEGRPVSRAEILAMLRKEKRQHSLVRQRRIDQIIQSLHERPP